MDEIRNTPKELESGAARSSKQQALDDASIEPAAVVETGKDYQNAETIQTSLTAAVEGAESAKISRPEEKSVRGSLPAVHGDLGQATASEGPKGKPATPIPLPGPETAAAGPGKTAGIAGKDLSIPIQQGKIIHDPLSQDSTGGQKSGDSAPPSENATTAEPQEGKPAADKTQTSKTGEGKTIQQPTGNLGPGNVGAAKIPGPERIIPELAKDARDLIGMGANGMIENAGSQKAVHSSKIKGYGPGAVDNTHSTKVPSFGKDIMPGFLKPGTSGGGPPVQGYGPGMVGSSTVKPKTSPTDPALKNLHKTAHHPKNADSNGSKKGDENLESTIKNESDKLKSEGKTAIVCGHTVDEFGNKWEICYFPVTKKWGAFRWNSVDAGNPVPYTGGAAKGMHPKPQTIGGKDVESGHYTPLVSVGGKTVSGGGTSGEPGTEWDEGHWYGGLFGSAGRPNDPDNPDYYTPNILDQADKAEKSNS